MDIQWHGLSCFSFRGKNATVVTDPYDAKLAGIKLPKISGDIVLANIDNPLHHAVTDISGDQVRVFDWPGEYEALNVVVQAIPAFDRPREKDDGKKDSAEKVVMFSLNIDGFKICHLSNLGHKLTAELLESIGNVDILLVPVGGENCLNAQKAHEVIEQIDPRIVIPMYYAIPGLKVKEAELDLFLKEVGIHSPVTEKTLKLSTPSMLPQDTMEFKILEPVVG